MSKPRRLDVEGRRGIALRQDHGSKNLALDSSRDCNDNTKIIYWHRELPPFGAELIGEHTVEATSRRVPGTIAHRDELWDLCYDDLMTQTKFRLEQEVIRLGGHYAHVLGEAIDSRHDEAHGETWLHGYFTYSLYRQPKGDDLKQKPY